MPRLKVPEFERIFLASFVEDESELELIGDASFTCNLRFEHRAWRIANIVMRSPIGYSENTVHGTYKHNRGSFLNLVNTYLDNNFMFLTEVCLSPKRLFGLFPYKLEGKLYKEVQKEE
jgi:hypothetical protein